MFNLTSSKLFSSVAALSLLGLSACSPEPVTPPEGVTVDYTVENVHIVDFVDGQPVLLENQTIAVNGGVISAIYDADSTHIPAATEVIAGNNGYVLAGFTEMHGHVPPATGFGRFPDRYVDDMLFLYVANGVTTVRGMLGYPHQLDLKKAIASGEKVGPTLYLAGPSFNGNSIESPEQATQRVIDQRDEGWDLLKIHPGLTLAEYQALAATANQSKMEFAGHVPADVGLENALKAGQVTIDHLDGYLEAVDALDRPITDDELTYLVELSLQYQVAVVPTQALWATLIGAGDNDYLRSFPELGLVPEVVRQGWLDYIASPASAYFAGDSAAVQQANRQALLKALYLGGVPIIFGTDAPQLFSVPGFSIHREIPYLQAAGMTNADIIYSATVAAGDYFAEESVTPFGRIAPGQRADFLLVPENPLMQLETLTSHQGVMVRGSWLSRADIEAKIAEIRAAYQTNN